jgi:hypothetical protein
MAAPATPQITPQRASLGFAEALDDLADLAPAAPRARPAPATAATAARAGFVSREPRAAGQGGEAPSSAPSSASSASGTPRRRRTGRSAQLNLKARPETIAAYVALADRMGWGLGETLEEAVRLLQAAHGTGTPQGTPQG